MKIPPSVWQMNLNKSNEIRNKMKEKIVFFFLFLISFELIKCKNEGLPGILGTREHNRIFQGYFWDQFKGNKGYVFSEHEISAFRLSRI